MAKNRLFVNGGNILHKKRLLDTSAHFKNSFLKLLDLQNMGLETLIVELCALLAEIWQNMHFPVMTSLICIKMVCGTFCQLFNIANRFLWYLSRNIDQKLISGGCTIPPSSCPTSGTTRYFTGHGELISNIIMQ